MFNPNNRLCRSLIKPIKLNQLFDSLNHSITKTAAIGYNRRIIKSHRKSLIKHGAKSRNKHADPRPAT